MKPIGIGPQKIRVSVDFDARRLPLASYDSISRMISMRAVRAAVEATANREAGQRVGADPLSQPPWVAGVRSLAESVRTDVRSALGVAVAVCSPPTAR